MARRKKEAFFSTADDLPSQITPLIRVLSAFVNIEPAMQKVGKIYYGTRTYYYYYSMMIIIIAVVVVALFLRSASENMIIAMMIMVWFFTSRELQSSLSP